MSPENVGTVLLYHILRSYLSCVPRRSDYILDHLNSETEMLQVEDHLNLLSAQYLVQCLDTENVCHTSIDNMRDNRDDNGQFYHSSVPDIVNY